MEVRQVLLRLQKKQLAYLADHYFKGQTFYDRSGKQRDADLGMRTAGSRRRLIDAFLYRAAQMNLRTNDIIAQAHLLIVQYPDIKDEMSRIRNFWCQVKVGDVMWFDNTLHQIPEWGGFKCILQPLEPVPSYPFLKFTVVSPGRIRPFRGPVFRLNSILWEYVPPTVSAEVIQAMSRGDWQLRPFQHVDWHPEHFEKRNGSVCLIHLQEGYMIQQVRSLPQLTDDAQACM